MLTSKVARRYAQGLLNVTQENGSTDAMFREMQDMVKSVSASKELQSFFASPIIETRKKQAVADEIFRSFSPLTQNLLRMVISHGRESQLQNIAQDFINKVEDLKGVQRITLTSATELSQDNIRKILSSTSLVKQGQEADVKTVINPDILGGYILRVGDEQVDASVRTKLNGLKKSFQLN